MGIKQLTLNSFIGGLNTSADETMLGNTSSPDLLNIDVLDSGAIKRRNGYSKFISPSTSSVDIIGIYRTDGVEQLVTQDSTGLVKSTDIAGVAPKRDADIASLNSGITSTASPYSKSTKTITITAPTVINVPFGVFDLYTQGIGYIFTSGDFTATCLLGQTHMRCYSATGTATITPDVLPNTSLKVGISIPQENINSCNADMEYIVQKPMDLSSKPTTVSIWTMFEHHNGYSFNCWGYLRFFGFNMQMYRNKDGVERTEVFVSGKRLAQVSSHANGWAETRVQLVWDGDTFTATPTVIFGKTVSVSGNTRTVGDTLQIGTRLKRDHSATDSKSAYLYVDRVELDGVPMAGASA